MQKMSRSKVLTNMWREMKENFEAMLLKARREDKLPSRKELMDHQESVQDLVDIFNTVSGNNNNGSQTNQARPASVETESEQRSPVEGKKHRRHFSKQQEGIIWSKYVSNYMQYLTREMFQAVASELDRSEDSVRYHLRKLIALHRGVPFEFALDNAFSNQEDARIWDYYTSNVSDSYQSEGAIVSSLADELQRPREEVRNRLLWLKTQQNHNPPPSAPYPAKSKQKAVNLNHQSSHGKSRHNQYYTPDEDALILKCLDQEHMSLQEVARKIGRTMAGVSDHVKRLRQKSRGSRGSDGDSQSESAGLDEGQGENGSEGEIEDESGGECNADHGEEDREGLSNDHLSVNDEPIDDDEDDEDNRSIGIEEEAYLTRRGATSSTTAVAASACNRYLDSSRKRPNDAGPVSDTSPNKRRKRAADFFEDADLSETCGNHEGAESDPQFTDSDIDSFSELENEDDDL